MQRPFVPRYWVFQLAGWGVFIGINLFFAVFVMDRFSIEGLQRLLFFVEMGIVFTHLMREVIRSTQILIRSFRQQIITFIILILLFSIMAAACNTPFEFFYTLRRDKVYTYQDLVYSNFATYLSIF